MISDLEPDVAAHGEAVGAALRSGSANREDLTSIFQAYRNALRWLEEARRESAEVERQLAAARLAVAECEETRRRLAGERRTLEGRREIFTVDVELDEVQTAFKLTFMNLCCELMRSYLGQWMELETLMDAVLTLPGERVVTATTETVRIYRPARDRKTLAAVEQACAALTARGLRRDQRALPFEVVGAGAAAAGAG